MKGIRIFLKKKKSDNIPGNDVETIWKKKKKCQYGRKQYKNLPKDKKQSLVEYRNVYFKKWKNKKASQ